MTQLSQVQQQVLARIASGESHSYNDLVGGHQFSSFAQHPQIRIPLPNGLYSTAAGRYQIIAPTWAEVSHRLGLKDFSPASQDAAAWDIAQRTYQQRTGRDLAADQASGQADFSVLGNQWTSLKGQKPSTAPSAAILASDSPLALRPVQQGTIQPSPLLDPNPGSELDPATALASLRAATPGVQLTPVDHHPWGLGPSLIPVSHNPFQQEANNAN